MALPTQVLALIGFCSFACDLAGQTTATAPVTVSNGIDLLVAERFERLRDKNIGLITNHTGRALDGSATATLLQRAPGVKLVRLFSPEHGIAGKLDRKIADSTDPETGLLVHSLYGEHRKPTAEMLAGIDTLVFDIQDIGCRFYTYLSTLGLVLEAAAEHKLTVLVLDRPNPLGGIAIEGPLTEPGRESFTACHAIPVRHGMTLGELAGLLKAERKLELDLQVVTMTGWRRGMWFDAAGQTWVNPSPNMRSVTAALLYPGMGLWEFTNVSVGRGTDTPFEVFGAPWIDGRQLAARMNALALPGLRCVPIRFTPTASRHQGQECGGVHFVITDREHLTPVTCGIALATVLYELYPAAWDRTALDRLLVHAPSAAAIAESKSHATVVATWQTALAEFATRRRPFLLYGE